MRKFALFLMIGVVGFIACEKQGIDSNEPFYPRLRRLSS